jgi:hypothetical protein
MVDDDEKLANRQDESAYLGEYEAGTYLTSKNTFCTQATTLISTLFLQHISAGAQIRKKIASSINR